MNHTRLNLADIPTPGKKPEIRRLRQTGSETGPNSAAGRRVRLRTGLHRDSRARDRRFRI